MIASDRCRRAACVVLVAVFLVMVPSMATAKFTGSQAPTLSVSTDRMETPTNLTGTYSCTKSGPTEYMRVTFTTFTDIGPAGSTYGFGLALGTVVKDSDTSTTKSVTLNANRPNDNRTTTWTIGVQAFLENWNGGIGTETITCPSKDNKTGTF